MPINDALELSVEEYIDQSDASHLPTSAYQCFLNMAACKADFFLLGL